MFLRGKFIMLNTVWAEIREGKLVILGEIDAPEGTRAIVTFLDENGDQDFWQAASTESLDEIWDNEEDDVYAELLEE